MTIVILSLFGCSFTLKQRNGRGSPNGNGDGEVQTTEVTVYDYFVHHRHIELGYSATLPCINVGKPKRPTYYPVEVRRTSILFYFIF